MNIKTIFSFAIFVVCILGYSQDSKMTIISKDLKKVKNRITGEIYYVKKNNNEIRHGPYFRYLSIKKEKGLLVKGKYSNGKKTGDWYYYTKTGLLSRRGIYYEGEKNGEWMYNHCDTENLKSKGLFDKGKKIGQWSYYGESNELLYLFNHDTGTISDIKKIDNENKSIEPINEILPVIGGKDCFYKYIKGEFVCPEVLRNKKFSGRVVVYFMVNDNFEMIDFHYETDLDDELGHESIKLIKNGPIWIPKIENGKYIPTRISVPFKYSRL